MQFATGYALIIGGTGFLVLVLIAGLVILARSRNKRGRSGVTNGDIEIFDSKIIGVLRSITSAEGFSDLYSQFVESTLGYCRELEDALPVDDVAAREIVHSMKGSSATFGAVRIFKLCEQMSVCLAEGRRQDAQVLVDSIRAALKELQLALEE